MTDDPNTKPAGDDDPRDSRDDDAMRALLKRSLASKDEPPPPSPEFIRGVQRRIRQRSRGRFFADGWSTQSSRVNYALVAAIMLVLVAVAYFALGPMGVTR
jgi:hypothetical protein